MDHATIQRWVVKDSTLVEEAFHRRKLPVWVSWRMDETYIKIRGCFTGVDVLACLRGRDNERFSCSILYIGENCPTRDQHL